MSSLNRNFFSPFLHSGHRPVWLRTKWYNTQTALKRWPHMSSAHFLWGDPLSISPQQPSNGGEQLSMGCSDGL